MLPFSYPEVGATRGNPPSGYTVDHNRVQLGFGKECYERAIGALRNWKQFDLGWVQMVPAGTPIEVGSVVAIFTRHFGFWSLNACRVVYVINEDGPIRKFGFAYGTLASHVERGEERFTIAWHNDDDSVWYDILAFSRPNKLLSNSACLSRACYRNVSRRIHLRQWQKPSGTKSLGELKSCSSVRLC